MYNVLSVAQYTWCNERIIVGCVDGYNNIVLCNIAMAVVITWREDTVNIQHNISGAFKTTFNGLRLV